MLQKGEKDLLRGERGQEERHPEEVQGRRSSFLSSSQGDRGQEERHPEEVEGRRSSFLSSSQGDRMFDEMFKRRFMSMFQRGEDVEELYLPMDVYDDGESIVVKAEIPGIRREDINVQLTPDSITISGQKTSEQRVEQKNFFREERSFGAFSRTCRLPVETITDSARASFKDGVLEVRILKSEAATQRVKKLTVE